MTSAAIIVAAGASRRFGTDMPKQFYPLFGLPVFLWSVLAFKKIREFSQIILVVPQKYSGSLERYSKKYSFEVVKGGKERFDSVRAGLEKVNTNCRYIAIHDGARPLVTPELILRALKNAKRSGASVLAVPARDTVKLAGAGMKINRTIPRNTVWLAQTPQVFKSSIIREAYGKINPYITDDA
ncbi:MAG: IspD/TarI family cytidylyltransferase, partial [Elusimicrobiota bacterium]